MANLLQKLIFRSGILWEFSYPHVSFKIGQPIHEIASCFQIQICSANTTIGCNGWSRRLNSSIDGRWVFCLLIVSASKISWVDVINFISTKLKLPKEKLGSYSSIISSSLSVICSFKCQINLKL